MQKESESWRKHSEECSSIRSHCVLLRSKHQKTLGKWSGGEAKPLPFCSQKSNRVLQHHLFLPHRIYLFRTLSKVKAPVYFKSKPKVKQQSSQTKLHTSLSACLCQEPPSALSFLFFPSPFPHPLIPLTSPKKTQSRPFQALKDSRWGEREKYICIQRGNKLLFYA